MIKERARALIYKGNEILMIQRLREGSEYYVLPGGGIEEGETPESAVMREIKEETSVEVKLVKKLGSVLDREGTKHHIYLCEYISGIPKLMSNSPEATETTGLNIYIPMWISSDTLSDGLIWPEGVRQLIRDYFRKQI